MALKISAPRGTKDVLPGDVYKWQFVERVFRETAGLFGYREHRFPTFEHTELFVRGVGDTTDVVQKEMYTFTDKGGRSVTLRPEGTASVVRSFLEHSLYAAGLPVKSCYLISNFRYEKPQEGRLREFHQFGAECIGSAEPIADAELIGLADAYFRRLGIRGLALELNSIGCPECRPKFHSALRAYFDGRKNELCDTCLTRLERNPMRILDCKNPACAELAKSAPTVLDFLCDDCKTHFDRTKALLTEMGIPFSINPNIVRGLDYYTRTVFEFVSDQIGAQGTVCGGGRYDGLVSELGGQPMPALGFAGGVERLLLVMEAQGVRILEEDGCDLFVAVAGEEAMLPVQRLVQELRFAGVSVERDLMGRALKAQMKYASRIRARYCVVVGEEEIQNQKVMLKDMQTGEQVPIELNAQAIRAKLPKV